MRETGKAVGLVMGRRVRVSSGSGLYVRREGGDEEPFVARREVLDWGEGGSCAVSMLALFG